MDTIVKNYRFDRGRKSNKFGVKQDVDYERVIQGYTDCGCNAGFEGGVVLDPLMGSGTSLVVAWRLKRQAIGFDVSEHYVELARSRLAQALRSEK